MSMSIRIKLDKPIYDADFYDVLKTFIDKIVQIQNNTVIVLEKL